MLNFLNGAGCVFCQSRIHQLSHCQRTAVCCSIIGLGSILNPRIPEKLERIWLKFPCFVGLMQSNFSFYVLCFYMYDEVKLDSRRAMRSTKVPSLPQEPAVGVPYCCSLI